MEKSNYIINKTSDCLELAGNWNAPAWEHAEELEISYFHPDSSNHKPETAVKLLYDDDAIYCQFRVRDRYVRCIHREYMDMVCEDSCVEWFVQPVDGRGYFNIEINCGGALHCSYIEDPERTPTGFKKFTPVPKAEGEKIKIYHSLPETIEPEIQSAIAWVVTYSVPFEFFVNFTGKFQVRPGDKWRTNFFKCGDQTSHPHWASWSPISELNFHQPKDFGSIVFG